jgi:aminomethyltransferase
MPLYGHELVAATDPFAIGLGFAVNLATADGSPREFPGAAALRSLQADRAGRVRVGLVCDGKRAAREGSIVTRPGDPTAVVGTVTSGSYCPTLGTAAAMALVDREAAAEGTPLDVVIRDTAAPARVAPLPLYRRPATPS